ncbi:LuxR C-terminal-related transcriptional regulator [Sphaerisporangium sp. B11E5]|uniref:ATP-binding protein n=1 Tax=Sphaerisporangium sp. B11E5 TaxID=3153563 RepID=UPI00325EFEA1
MPPMTGERRRARGMPAEVTSFVGRRREMADVRAMLSTSRLVTLVGAGGVGKTRLATRVAAEVRRTYPGGVWFVELGASDGCGLLPQSVADALHIQEDPARSPLDSVIEYLRDRRALLVLDNCEHRVRECAVLLHDLLASVPDLQVMVTSRQALGIAGEQILSVPPLPLPDHDHPPLSTGSLARVDAIRLFAERAAAVVPGFAVTDENRDAVVRICRRLDGVPLVIELAAVRLRALSVQQLLDRLDDRFRLLTAGSTAVSERHRTLRALIDWSYELCTEPERLFWARASVFEGSLDLEAAEAVCPGDGIAREEVLDLVIGLVEKSVLLREEHPGGVRYRLLDSIREYGAERLAAQGDQERLALRHRDYYAEMAADFHARLFSGAQLELLTRMRLEHANVRTAMRFSLDRPAEAAVCLRMAIDLLYHWKTSSHVREGRQWLDQALAAATEPTPLRARALAGNAWLAIFHGEKAEALAMLMESRSLAERLGLDDVLADVVLYSGMVAMDDGDPESAKKLYHEALAGHRSAGNDCRTALTLNRLCLAFSEEGESAQAVAAAEESIAICVAHGEGWHRAYALMALAVEVWRRGDAARAVALARDSLRITGPLNDWFGIRIALEVLAWAAASDGDALRAARMLGALRAIRRTPGMPLSGFGHLAEFHDECTTRIRTAIGPAGLTRAADEGARLPLEEILSYALGERDLPSAPAAHPSPLTRRETEIAELVARGLSNKEIAAALVISQRTAEGHIEHIMSKLNVHSRGHIAAWVQENRTPEDHKARDDR